MRSRSLLFYRTRSYRVPLLSLSTSMCSDFTGSSNEPSSVIHREQLRHALDAQEYEKAPPGGWSSRMRACPRGTVEVKWLVSACAMRPRVSVMYECAGAGERGHGGAPAPCPPIDCDGVVGRLVVRLRINLMISSKAARPLRAPSAYRHHTRHMGTE